MFKNEKKIGEKKDLKSCCPLAQPNLSMEGNVLLLFCAQKSCSRTSTTTTTAM
jgi:hypothetical protein